MSRCSPAEPTIEEKPIKIYLDKIELVNRVNALRLTTHFEAEKQRCVIYFDTELRMFFVLNKRIPGETNKYSGQLIVPPSNVAAAQVSEDSIPQHQPIGTTPERDTPSGNRKARTDKTAKSAIAEAAEKRKASKAAPEQSE